MSSVVDVHGLTRRFGEMTAVDTPDGLRGVVRARQYVEVSFEGEPPAGRDLEAIPGVAQVSANSGRFHLYTETPGRVAAETIRFADSKGRQVGHICTRKPSLEDVYVHITGEEDQEAPDCLSSAWFWAR